MARVTLSTDLDLARQAFRRVEAWGREHDEGPWRDLAAGLLALVDAIEYVTEGVDSLGEETVGSRD